jgi:hypothetical protein
VRQNTSPAFASPVLLAAELSTAVAAKHQTKSEHERQHGWKQQKL